MSSSSTIGNVMKKFYHRKKRRPTASARKEMELERQQEAEARQQAAHQEEAEAQEHVEQQERIEPQEHMEPQVEDEHEQEPEPERVEHEQESEPKPVEHEQELEPFEHERVEHHPVEHEDEQFQQHFEPHADAEPGFPGGPRDTSLLTSYETHVASFIWCGEEDRGILKCHNHTSKLHNWVIPNDNTSSAFRAIVRGTRLHRLRQICYVDVNKVLVSAFVERWHPETNTFHMPFGEMTITLDDVFCLLGLPITGDPLSSVREVDATYVSNMLGVPLDEVYEGIGNKRGASVTLEWLRVRFNGDVTSEDPFRVGCAARAYLFFVLGCTIFADKSGTRVPIAYLEWLEDPENLDNYAWGAATLAYLYRQLGQASRYNTKQIAGSMALLEAWIYLRFSYLRPPHNVEYKSRYPLAYRWIPQGNQGRRLDRLKAARERIDRLTSRDVEWCAYDRKVRRHFPWHQIATYLGCKQMGTIVEPYHPDRVLRQFGYVQTIPSRVIAPNCGPRDYSKALHLWLGMAAYWLTSDSHLLSEERLGRLAQREWDCAPGYIEWYRERSHVVVQPPDTRSRYVNTTTTDAVAADSDDRMWGVVTTLIDPTVQRWRAGDRSIPYDDLGSLLDRVHTVIHGRPDEAGPSHVMRRRRRQQ